MNTATIPRTFSSSVVGRFAWKDCRRLFGFAAGVAGLAVVEMLLSRLLVAKTALPNWMLISSFGAAAFFAIGAAITLFAVEREEDTDRFLQTLPRFWSATLLGKLIAAIVMTILVVVVLSIVGGLVAGGRWPSIASGQLIVAQGGVVIVEALAWGVLLSLLCPRPLLGAVLAIAATSASSQLAIFLTDERAKGMSSEDYQAAIPMRLAIVALVVLVDVSLARRWLNQHEPRLRRGVGGWRPMREPVVTATSHATAARHRAAAPLPIVPATRRAIVLRLVWQTFRESWKMMLAVFAGGAFLMFTLELLWSQVGERHYLPVSLLFIPALFGALTFRCDQRRGAYRFLAEHAGRPRLLWLVRTAVWITPVLVLWSIVSIVGMAGSRWLVMDNLRIVTERSWHFSSHVMHWSLGNQALLEVQTADVLYYGLLTSWLGAIAAYAIGQLASLLIRSEILAAGVALGGSIVLLLWCYLVVYWRLPPVWCIGPIAAGALFASWLRAPAWLIDRHSAARWTAVALAVVLPLVAVVLSIPLIRINQMSFITSSNVTTLVGGQQGAANRLEFVGLGPALRNAVEEYKAKLNGAEETTRAYQQIVEEIWPSTETIPTFSPDGPEEPGGVFTRERSEQIKAIVELTERTAVKVEPATDWTFKVASILGADMWRLLDEGQLDESFDRYLALQRLIGQVMQNNSIRFAPGSVAEHFRILELAANASESEFLVEWATVPDQTSDRLKAAVKSLWEVEQSHFPPLNQGVVADYIRVRRVVEGRELPDFVQNNKDLPPKEQMALVLNDLSWERQRAHFALDAYAGATLDYVTRVKSESGLGRRILLRPSVARESAVLALAHQHGLELRKQRYRQLLQAETSLIVALEWPSQHQLADNLREQLLAQTRRSLERLRMALIAYRLDHGEYPAKLRDLAPDYIAPAPLDPFGGEWFGYEPDGFDLPVWDHDYRARLFEPDTPLIWSVGPGNASPTQTIVNEQATEEDSNMGLEESESESEQIDAMIFQPSEYWSRGAAVVLPLPK